MTYTDFKNPLLVSEVRTTLRATYLILDDGRTVLVSDRILEELKNLSLSKARRP